MPLRPTPHSPHVLDRFHQARVARAPSPAKSRQWHTRRTNAQVMFIHHRQTMPVCHRMPIGTRLMSSTPLAKYRYRRRLPHLQKADCDLFVTFCTARKVLPPEARDLVLEHCLREGGILPFANHTANLKGERARATLAPRADLHAVVVMPDHVHLLLQPLRDNRGWPVPLVDILQCLKGATAHRINKLLGTSGPVWEEESFDHVLRSNDGLQEKAEYIRQNPVRRSLVRRPEQYRWLWINPKLNSCGAGAPAREK